MLGNPTQHTHHPRYEDMMRDPATELRRVLEFAGWRGVEQERITKAARKRKSSKDPEGLVPGLPQKWLEDFPWATITDALLDEWGALVARLDEWGGEEAAGGGGASEGRHELKSAEGVRGLLRAAYDAADTAAQRAEKAGRRDLNFSTLCGEIPHRVRLPI